MCDRLGSALSRMAPDRPGGFDFVPDHPVKCGEMHYHKSPMLGAGRTADGVRSRNSAKAVDFSHSEWCLSDKEMSTLQAEFVLNEPGSQVVRHSRKSQRLTNTA